MIKLLVSIIISIVAFFSTIFIQQQNDQKPDWNRFTRVVLAEGFDEPMAMAFINDQKTLIIERKGDLKMVNEKTKETTVVGHLDVNTKYTNKAGVTREAEEGLVGITLDPNYIKNNYIYLLYAHPTEAKHVLSRFVFKNDELQNDTEKVLLTYPVQRRECCHTGGGMTWDRSGNLFMTIGNNTVNPRQGTSNLVELPGSEDEDDQRAAGNTNDLRGKIIRIHPEPNGTYTIPKGNLFAPGNPKARAEIYTMGHRNPWRINIDSKTGYIYWGEVGPDNGKDSTWGPRGYDEFNQAKGPGFFGWPYFIGNNRPYRKYDSKTITWGEEFDVNNPQNLSVNNTGLTQLPKPTPAFIYYPYGPSEEFPLLGTSGRSATGGPIFHAENFKNAKRPWPAYYEGKWLMTEFMRGWIIAVTMDKDGNYQSMEKVVPDMNFSSAIDMNFGPSGDMYVLEYGSAWFRGNDNARLVKIEYNAGNRKPTAVATADKTSGSLPLTIKLSAEGSADNDPYDQNKLTYTWKILNARKQIVATLKGKNVSHKITLPGNYTAQLEVTDTKLAKNNASIPLTAGNAAPYVNIELAAANQSFYFSKDPIAYNVKVNDKEDGSTDTKIKADEVAVTFDYIPQGFDPIEIAAKQRSADDMASYAIGKNLIEQNDCKSCHQYKVKSIGPSYTDVAKKYPNTKANLDYLVKKIKEGGAGVWGEHGMAAHPDLSEINAKRIVDYIFSLEGNTPNVAKLGIKGQVSPQAPAYEFPGGSYVLRAAYKDRGAAKTKALLGEKVLHLRSNYLRPQETDFASGVQRITTAQYQFQLQGDGSYTGYRNIDLTGIKQIVAYTVANTRNGAIGGYVELHLGSPSGPVIAKSEMLGQKDVPFERPPAGANFAEFQRARSLKAELKLNPDVKGQHDVYLVFRNPAAKPTDILLQLTEVGFLQ
jgi:cytochrome c